MIFLILISAVFAKNLDWAQCPTLEQTENIEKFTCRKAACKLVCKPGKSIVGVNRVMCKDSANGAKWSKEIGKCSGCKDENPTPNDPSYVTELIPLIFC